MQELLRSLTSFRKSRALQCILLCIPAQWLAITALAATNPPLYDDLGDLHYSVTANAEAQPYFDQGMRLYYAFNHAEAIAAFRAAQQLDPACAMCWWGEALSWGPNINLPMDNASGIAAYAALQQATSRAANVSAKEQGLIDALARRYSVEPQADRSALDLAYADAMQTFAALYPQDDEIVVLAGEAVMDLSPWDYWTATDQLRPRMVGALAGFTEVMARTPQHPGACHFYIHAVEKVQPERAVECAENLAELMPGAGHLVHMPGHIYIRVGRYLDAIRVNEHAVHADETYIRDRRPAPGMYTGGYYPHNYDFLAFAALMIGREEQAINAADKLAALIPPEALLDPSVTYPQHYAMRPALVRIRFDRWQEILAMPKPDAAAPHAEAIWYYAQGRAQLAMGNTAAAKQSLERVQAHATGTALATARLEFNAAQEILGIAVNVLAGMIANAEGKIDEAVNHLQMAVNAEDALLYGEPPEWTVPVRQELGEVLLEANRASEAEVVFRADLLVFPENSWSLAGLSNALQAQGKQAESDSVAARLYNIAEEKGVAHLAH